MPGKLNVKANMDELDKLGETIENALTEKYGDGAEGGGGRIRVNSADTCAVMLSEEVHERLLCLSEEHAISIDRLITKALDRLYP